MAPRLKLDSCGKTGGEMVREVISRTMLERENDRSDDTVMLSPHHSSLLGRRRAHAFEADLTKLVAWTAAARASMTGHRNDPGPAVGTQAVVASGKGCTALETEAGYEGFAHGGDQLAHAHGGYPTRE